MTMILEEDLKNLTDELSDELYTYVKVGGPNAIEDMKKRLFNKLIIGILLSFLFIEIHLFFR